MPLTPESRQGACGLEHGYLEDLLALYSWSLDRGDVDTFTSLFAAGGWVEDHTDRHRPWDPMPARAYAEMCLSSPSFAGRQHWTALTQMRRNEEGFALRSFAMATQLMGPGSTVIVWTGYAEDVLRADGERLLFVSRKIRPWNGRVLSGFPDLVAVDDRWAGARGVPA